MMGAMRTLLGSVCPKAGRQLLPKYAFSALAPVRVLLYLRTHPRSSVAPWFLMPFALDSKLQARIEKVLASIGLLGRVTVAG